MRGADLNKNRASLNGQWYYFENQLLTPREVTPGLKGFAEFPKTWNDIRSSGTGSGYATYMLYVLPPGDVKTLAIELPQIYSSYTLWINNKLVASNGTVGTSGEETVPQWMPQTVSFENPGDTLQLVLQIANFHHYKGGLKDPIYLGSSVNGRCQQPYRVCRAGSDRHRLFDHVSFEKSEKNRFVLCPFVPDLGNKGWLFQSLCIHLHGAGLRLACDDQD